MAYAKRFRSDYKLRDRWSLLELYKIILFAYCKLFNLYSQLNWIKLFLINVFICFRYFSVRIQMENSIIVLSLIAMGVMALMQSTSAAGIGLQQTTNDEVYKNSQIIPIFHQIVIIET